MISHADQTGNAFYIQLNGSLRHVVTINESSINQVFSRREVRCLLNVIAKVEWVEVHIKKPL